MISPSRFRFLSNTWNNEVWAGTTASGQAVIRKIYRNYDNPAGQGKLNAEIEVLKLKGWHIDNGVYAQAQNGKPASYYVDMVQLPGEEFRKIQMRKHQPCEHFTLLDWIDIFCQLAEQIKFLHDRNWLHADIKSENILLDVKNKKATLFDFDLSLRCQPDAHVQVTPGRWGTHDLMCPRTVRLGHVSRHSDIFTFSIVMQEVLQCYNFENSEIYRYAVRMQEQHDSLTIEEVIQKLNVAPIQHEVQPKTDKAIAALGEYAGETHARWRAFCPAFMLSRDYHRNWGRIQALKKQLASPEIPQGVTATTFRKKQLKAIQAAICEHASDQLFKNVHSQEHYLRLANLGKASECLLNAFNAFKPTEKEKRALIDAITQTQAYQRMKQARPGLASKALYRLCSSLGLSFDAYEGLAQTHARTPHYNPADSKARAMLSIYRY